MSTARTISLRTPSNDARRETTNVSDRDPASPPLWQQILTDLERRIAAGDISGRFPTDKELTEQYGVSRHTVREAVRRLRARGLVERHRGRGSFINDTQVAQPLGGIYSLFRAVEERGLEQRSEVLALETHRDPDAATWLGLPPRAELVRLDRLRYADDEPLALDSVWLPADVGRPLLEVDFSRTALYDELRDRVGVAITAVDETLEPVVPDHELRDLLHLDDDEALFRVRRLGRSDDRPVECRLTLIRGRRFVYTSSWRRAGEPPAAGTASEARWVTTS
jgi:GntR family transcriptional regulator